MFRDDPGADSAIRFNMKAVAVLGRLMLIVSALTALCILLPLALTARREALGGTTPLFCFFAAIGLGFMFVEISQMQRLIVFLGHPTYSLSVVLFSLLLSSGLGSYSTQRMSGHALGKETVLRFLLLLCFLLVFGLLAPHAVQSYRGMGTALRIGVAVAMLFPLGLFMGMAFPIGMKLAASRSSAILPWLWGLNGATSVNAAVFAVAISLTAGISVAFWCGVLCYAVAFICFLWTGGRR